VEGRGYSLICSIYQNLSGRSEENHETPVRIPGVLDEILTGHLRNTSQKHYNSDYVHFTHVRLNVTWEELNRKA
jgi:hypothetical protein